jgi:predicted ATPase
VELAELLAKLRTARGMSQEQLARAAAISARAIGDLERGATRRPQRNTIDALAIGLHLSDDERAALHAAARRHPPRAARRTERSAPALVGRGADVAAVTGLLRRPQTRMVTIGGPAGVGKSALAREVARRADALFRCIGFADLASLDDPVAAAAEIERSLEPGRSVVGTFDEIAARVAGERWLLVLDGVDGVLAVASDLADLLTRCPRVSLLVTARSPMRLRAEQMWPLSGLATGDVAASDVVAGDVAAGDVAAGDVAAGGVDLLVERARAVRPGFARSSGLVALCELLDGVPLAIELAAFGLRTRDPAELVAALTGHRPGAASAPVADRVVAWVIDELHDEARRVLAVLGAFAGGTSVDALRAVMARASLPTERVHASIAALVGAGLVTVEDRSGRARVLVPHTAVREAARRRLDASGAGPAVRAAHARHFGERLASATGDQADLADERDNVRTAAREPGVWEAATVAAAAAYLSAQASAAEAARLLAGAQARST